MTFTRGRSQVYPSLSPHQLLPSHLAQDSLLLIAHALDHCRYRAVIVSGTITSHDCRTLLSSFVLEITEPNVPTSRGLLQRKFSNFCFDQTYKRSVNFTADVSMSLPLSLTPTAASPPATSSSYRPNSDRKAAYQRFTHTLSESPAITQTNPITLTRFIHAEQSLHPSSTGSLTALLHSLQLAIKLIAQQTRKAGLGSALGLAGSANASGESQKCWTCGRTSACWKC